jgi:soluble lytic murein transglycosylase-like protein
MDPKANLRAGIRYLAQLKKAFKGDLVLTLAAYNAGPTKVASLGAVPDHHETRQFVVKVLSLADSFRTRFQSIALR